MAIRLLRAEDEHAARALVDSAVAGTPYGELPRLALERALAGGSAESLAVVAVEGEALVGLALYGLVAGTRGAAKLHFTAGTSTRQLLDEVATDLRRRGARLLVAELPADPAVRAWRGALEACGFAIEGRVADYHRDGVDLLLLRREL